MSGVGDDEAVHLLVERDSRLLHGSGLPPVGAPVPDGIYTKNMVFREVFL